MCQNWLLIQTSVRWLIERSDTDTQEPNAEGMHTFPDLLDMRLVNKVVGSLIELQKNELEPRLTTQSRPCAKLHRGIFQ